MEITLRIKGKEKTFVQNFVSGYCYRKVLELQKNEEGKSFSPALLDKEVELVCDVFDKQFSREDFYNGINAEKGNLQKEINRILLNEILGIPSEDEMNDFLNNQEKASQ